MAAPETHITWDDQSAIPPITFPEDDTDYPVFLSVITADKGPETWQQNVTSKNFYKLYGQPSFKKHGQSSIQSAYIVDKGGKLVIKRVVATNATLANISIVAHVGIVQKVVTDNQGNIKWIKSDGTTVYLPSTETPTVRGQDNDDGSPNLVVDENAHKAKRNTVQIWFSAHTVLPSNQSEGDNYDTTYKKICNSIYSIHNSSRPFTLIESNPEINDDDLYDPEAAGGSDESNQYIYDKSNLPSSKSSLSKADLLDATGDILDSDTDTSIQGYTSINHYILFTVCDNGRGVSNKTFRIFRDSSRSAPVLYTKYFIEISENGTVLESIPFTMNPNIIETNRSASLEDSIFRNSSQIKIKFYDEEFEGFTNYVSELLGMTDNEYSYVDCLFGKDNRGETYESKGSILGASTGTDGRLRNDGNSLQVLLDPLNISSITGIPLESGTNGDLGDSPYSLATNELTKEAYSDYFENAFAEEKDDNDVIRDIDNVRIDAVFDANYPLEVKRAIENFVSFRQDCVFFRDYGLDIYSLEDINAYEAENDILRNRFCSSYISVYDIYDPYTKKHITITMTYHLAGLFVKHFINGRNRPFCGQKYSVVIPTEDYIPGSLRFSPKTLSGGKDEKEILDTKRLNYCKFYDGSILTVASEYTSQIQYTQLSFVNNVLAVQEVIKAIRSVCPKIRYSFIDAGSDDFTRYKDDIDELIISKYANRFKSCEIEYMTDDVYTLNKIIYAVIRVRFRDFVQTEYFKITALI